MCDHHATSPPSALGERTTIYRYGPVAWFSRALIAGALVGGTASLVLGARLADGHVEVRTLLFWRRHVPRDHLGAPRLRQVYQGRSRAMYAPGSGFQCRGGCQSTSTC